MQMEWQNPVMGNRKSAVVAEKIKTMILGNDYQPGDKLPSENEIANLLSVSRATVREGFHALELIGIIKVKPGVGAFVKDSNIFNLLEFSDSRLTILFASEAFTIYEVLEARKIIDTSIAELLAENVALKDLSVLEESLSEMGKSFNNENGFKGADRKFHRELARLTKNRLIQVLANSMYQIFWERFSSNHFVYSVNPQLAKRIFNIHKQILEALKQHNSRKARFYMLKHTKSTSEIYQEYIEKTKRQNGR
jgi:GntR family transcriptional regulator, transcriptional repressor for pyruvate dehydrogenase complex